MVAKKLSTTEGESTILKDIFWRRYAFKFYRLHCHTLSKCVAFHLSGLIHAVSNFFLCVNALLHFEQACGFLPVWNNFICFQMCLLCECLVTFKAGMKIFTSVDQFVGFQTTHQGECLGTF